MTRDLNKRNKARYKTNKAIWAIKDGMNCIYINRN